MKELIRLYKIGDWYLMLENKKGKGKKCKYIKNFL